MDPMSPLVTGGLLAVFTLVLTLLNKGQSDSLKRELSGFRAAMAEFRAEVRGEFAAVRGEFAAVRAEMGVIRAEMVVMRSDLTHVALAVGARVPPQSGTA